MSRTYQEHPELFPEMTTEDPYYEDHCREALMRRIDRPGNDKFDEPAESPERAQSE